MFQIEQIYSNADGTVQFVVLHEIQRHRRREPLGRKGAHQMTHAGVPKFAIVFPRQPHEQRNRPRRRVLIATPGFAALGLVTPDYTIPNGFLATDGGTLNYAGVDSVTYTALPTDGVNALNRSQPRSPTSPPTSPARPPP